ncbi:hypothetical protein ACT453_52700, partial [Bacillus sp. D-CC]
MNKIAIAGLSQRGNLEVERTQKIAALFLVLRSIPETPVGVHGNQGLGHVPSGLSQRGNLEVERTQKVASLARQLR